VVADSGAVVVEPLVGWSPLQPPEAVHDLLSVLVHCREAVDFSATVLVSAIRCTVGLATVAVPLVEADWSLEDH
jgi:hypothetical protein